MIDLVQKAKDSRPLRKKPGQVKELDPDILKLTLAVLNQEVTMAEASRALDLPGANATAWPLFRAIRLGVKTGLLKIVEK